MHFYNDNQGCKCITSFEFSCSLYNWINNKFTKKKNQSKFISFQWKEDTWQRPSISNCDAPEVTVCVLKYTWQKRICNYILSCPCKKLNCGENDGEMKAFIDFISANDHWKISWDRRSSGSCHSLTPNTWSSYVGVCGTWVL